MNTTGKIMDAVIARRLSYLAETYHVLPPTHMGGRKMRLTEHALHAVTYKIYEAWSQNTGQVASLLLLDVSGAFDNVLHARLLHDLRKRRVDEKTVKWIASFLSNRHTSIAIDGFRSPAYQINTGIPQGSPLSPILYLFYNADLIDECNNTPEAMSTGYIDDVGILAWGRTTEQTCGRLSRILEKAQRWASTHASVFAPNKFQLTHFTRSRKRINIETPIQTEWGEIRPAATCKYLGLTMDAKLHWKEHTEEIRRKATKTVNALSSLGGSNWGASLPDLRRIYEGTVLPQMMYACSIWSNASMKGKLYTRRMLNTLQSIQARAARVISGAYRATSRAALDVESYLLPIEQQIWKHNADTVIWLLSSRNIAATSGFQTSTAQPTAADKTRIRHTSSWEKVHSDMKSRQTHDFDRQEQIPCFLTPPWRQGPTTYIDTTAKRARARHDKEHAKEDSLSIYTDGSGIEGEIGSAALCPLTQEVRSAHMGSDTTSTVYAAELQGISLALQIAQEYASRNGARQHVAIYTDNQAAIWSIAKAEGRSGAYILADIARQVQELQDKGRTVTVRWIPAHVGIPGNEAVDKAAKEATGWREDGRRSSPADAPPNLYAIRSTAKRWCKTQAERAWIAKWRTDTKGRATYRHTPTPTKKVLQLHEGLTKRESALLVQLRTEKIGLNDFLFARRVPDVTSPRCDCGARRQTVAHILLHCSKRRTLRNRIFANLSGRDNIRTILSTPQLATKAIEYVEQTQILGQNGDRRREDDS
jgi:ribonuclease HI